MKNTMLVLFALMACAAQGELTRLVPEYGTSRLFTLKSSDTKLKGHVATHPDNSPEARFTFRIFASNHVTRDKQIFERAKGVWKHLEYIAE